MRSRRLFPAIAAMALTVVTTALASADVALAAPQPTHDQSSRAGCTLAPSREPGPKPGTINMKVYGCETQQVSVDVPWALDPYCRAVPLRSYAYFGDLPADAREPYLC